jgi:hypothetical protein
MGASPTNHATLLEVIGILSIRKRIVLSWHNRDLRRQNNEPQKTSEICKNEQRSFQNYLFLEQAEGYVKALEKSTLRFSPCEGLLSTLRRTPREAERGLRPF